MFNHDSRITTDMFNPIHIDYDNSYYSIPFGAGFYWILPSIYGEFWDGGSYCFANNTSNKKTWEERLA